MNLHGKEKANERKKPNIKHKALSQQHKSFVDHNGIKSKAFKVEHANSL